MPFEKQIDDGKSWGNCQSQVHSVVTGSVMIMEAWCASGNIGFH